MEVKKRMYSLNLGSMSDYFSLKCSVHTILYSLQVFSVVIQYLYHYRMITTISLVPSTTCKVNTLLLSTPPCWTLHPQDSLHNLEFVHLDLFHAFCLSPNPSFLWQPSLFSVSMSLGFLLFCLFIMFLDSTYK